MGKLLHPWNMISKVDGKNVLKEYQGTKHSWGWEEYIDCCNRRRMDAKAWLKVGVCKLRGVHREDCP